MQSAEFKEGETFVLHELFVDKDKFVVDDRLVCTRMLMQKPWDDVFHWARVVATSRIFEAHVLNLKSGMSEDETKSVVGRIDRALEAIVFDGLRLRGGSPSVRVLFGRGHDHRLSMHSLFVVRTHFPHSLDGLVAPAL